jgi:hypothetical protein
MNPLFRRAVLLGLAIAFAQMARADIFLGKPRLYQVGYNPSFIVAQDLNDDGWPEIITADRGVMSNPREERPANDELSLLIAQGNMNYVQLHPSLKTGFAPYAIAVANVDNLKYPDIIVANFIGGKHRDISVFLNKQQENIFTPLEFTVPFEGLTYHRQVDGDGAPVFGSPGLTALVVQDVNHDTFRDCIATGWSSDVLAVFPGTADSVFGPPHLIPAPGAPRDLQLADFDHDGNLDIVAVMYATNEVAFWRGDGKGNFAEVQRFPTRGRLPTRVKVADMNHDGIPDLVISHCHNDDSIVIFFGDGGFQFSVSQEIPLGETHDVLEHDIRDIVVEDFNGDGRPDIAAACFASKKVIVLLNESGDGAHKIRFTREEYLFDQGRPRAICTADFDKNGRPDLGVALWDADSIALLLNKTSEPAPAQSTPTGKKHAQDKDRETKKNP